MNELEFILDTLKEYIGGETGAAATAFSGKRASDKSQNQIALSLSGIKMTPVGFGGYLGKKGAEEIFAKKLELEAVFYLMCPKASGSMGALSLLGLLQTALSDEACPVCLEELTSEESVYDGDTDMFTLKAKGTFHGYLTAARESGGEIQDFKLGGTLKI